MASNAHQTGTSLTIPIVSGKCRQFCSILLFPLRAKHCRPIGLLLQHVLRYRFRGVHEGHRNGLVLHLWPHESLEFGIHTYIVSLFTPIDFRLVHMLFKIPTGEWVCMRSRLHNILQRGATPAGPPSYSAARIIPDLYSPTNTTSRFKMAEFVLLGSRPMSRHFRSAGRTILRNGQGTGTTPPHSSPFSFWTSTI